MESRPIFRVAAAGLDPRDVRLIEIVFKHSQYNRYEFVFEARLVADRVDILIVNPSEAEGLRALARLRTVGSKAAIVSALPRGAPGSSRHAISIDRLTLQLLPILNRVVELELLPPDTQPIPPSARPQPGLDAPRASHGALAAGLPPPPGPVRAAAPPAPGTASNPLNLELPTRDFMREAARKSREGDRARAAATGTVPASSAGFATMPAAAPVSAATPAPASNLLAFPLSPDAPVQRVRVLVVDDSPTVRQQLSLAFTRMGVLCDAAASAAEALQRLAGQHYDLTLVDVVMPDMDGYKLTRQIRRRHRGTPVIILTSRSSPFDLARGALAGCDTFLVKPVPLKRLEAAVVKQLRRSLAIDDLSGLIRLSSQAPPRRAVAESGAPGNDPHVQPPRSAGR